MDDPNRGRLPVIRRGLGTPTRSATKAPQQAEATLGTWNPSRCSAVNLGVLMNRFLRGTRHGLRCPVEGHDIVDERAEAADECVGSFILVEFLTRPSDQPGLATHY